MKIIKNFVFLLSILILSYLLGSIVGEVYSRLLGGTASRGLFGLYGQIAQFTFGVILSYIFFLTLLFTAFGGAKKYWWIGIALLPAILFEVAFDLQHIYFPIAIGLIAWLLGRGVALLVTKK